MSVKFLPIYLLFFLATANVAVGQPIEAILAKADSLYISKKYTESYQIYSNLFFEEGAYTDRSLLKMAYIQEGLGEYDKALFFLYKYYTNSYDSRVLNKIEELVTTFELVGYQQSDASFVINLIRKNFSNIVLLLAFFTILLCLIVAIKKFKLHQQPFYSGVGVFFFGIVLFAVINFSSLSGEAIIVNDKTFLMSGPSAGADLFSVVGKGHKVELIKQGSIWSKINYNGTIVFTRNENVLEIPQ
jgi:hypothetical protein